MTKKRYLVTAQIEIDGDKDAAGNHMRKTVAPGEVVELDEAPAAYLLEKGHVEPAPADPAPKGSKTLQSV